MERNWIALNFTLGERLFINTCENWHWNRVCIMESSLRTYEVFIRWCETIVMARFRWQGRRTRKSHFIIYGI